jgi:hypothetical protein
MALDGLSARLITQNRRRCYAVMSLAWRNGRGIDRLGNHFRWWFRGIETGEIRIVGQLWVPDVAEKLCATSAG